MYAILSVPFACFLYPEAGIHGCQTLLDNKQPAVSLIFVIGKKYPYTSKSVFSFCEYINVAIMELYFLCNNLHI